MTTIYVYKGNYEVWGTLAFRQNNYLGTITHNNTADRTYTLPDDSGNVAVETVNSIKRMLNQVTGYPTSGAPSPKFLRAIDNSGTSAIDFEWYVGTNPAGQPYKRDHKNRSLSFTYAKMNVPKEVIKTDHARGIYFTPLYDKTCEFLRGDDDGKDMKKVFDTDIGSISSLWKTKHAKPRIKQLVKKGKVSNESLFYDDLIYLTWEQAKNKYLPQVGR